VLKIAENVWAVGAAPNPAGEHSAPQIAYLVGRALAAPPQEPTFAVGPGLDFRLFGSPSSLYSPQCLGIWIKHCQIITLYIAITKGTYGFTRQNKNKTKQNKN